MCHESADRHRADPTVPNRYGRKPGIAAFIGRHIFNRSFRNNVNARVIALIKISARWTNLIPLISPRIAIFCAAVAARLRYCGTLDFG